LLPRGLSLGVAADYVGLSRRELYRLAERGLIHLIRLPGCRRVLVDRLQLDRLLEGHAEGQP
jgi:excisionase family DNA binding protein